jgi:hypothetical protein
MKRTRDRLREETGEGVISLAIAVLVIAALGALMWLGFNAIWEDAEGRIQDSVNQIGN